MYVRVMVVCGIHARRQTSHPETKKVSEVAKAGAAKWGTLTPEMKHPYEQQAAIKKVRARTHTHTHTRRERERERWRCLSVRGYNGGVAHLLTPLYVLCMCVCVFPLDSESIRGG